MKRIFVFISLVYIVINAGAQNPDSVKIYKNEIGIDATYFIKNIFDFGSNNFPRDIYFLSYKRFFNKFAFRFGFDISYSNSKYDHNNYTENHNSFALRTRYGLEHRCNFSEKWTFYYGADFIFHYYNSKSHSSNTTVTSKSKGLEFGFGPIIGIEFSINKRLSLSTEGSIYGILNVSETIQEDEYLPDDNASYISNYVNTTLPKTIFVKYKF